MVQINRNITLPSQPFDTQMAVDLLRRYRSPQDHLTHLCERGEIVRVRQGLYVPGWHTGEPMPVDPWVLAQLIYGPSYISLTTALSHYQLIPEQVVEITSVTTKRRKLFDTPLGRYSYTPISEQAFSYGVTLQERAGGHCFLATPEKALCDAIAQLSQVTTQKAIATALEDDLRVDLSLLTDFDLEAVDIIAQRYRRNNVRAFAGWLRKFQKHS